MGDVPSQVLEVYGRNRNFDREPPAFDDVRVRECRERGVFDLVDESGSESSYVVFLLEDGNRVLARYHGTVSTHRWPDGSRHYDLRGTLQLSGGSGRFGKIRGQLRIWQVLAPGG